MQHECGKEIIIEQSHLYIDDLFPVCLCLFELVITSISISRILVGCNQFTNSYPNLVERITSLLFVLFTDIRYRVAVQDRALISIILGRHLFVSIFVARINLKLMIVAINRQIPVILSSVCKSFQ